MLELRVRQVGGLRVKRNRSVDKGPGSQKDLNCVPFVSAVTERKKCGEANLLDTSFSFLFCFLLLRGIITSGFKPRPVFLVCIAYGRHL